MPTKARFVSKCTSVLRARHWFMPAFTLFLACLFLSPTLPGQVKPARCRKMVKMTGTGRDGRPADIRIITARVLNELTEDMLNLKLDEHGNVDHRGGGMRLEWDKNYPKKYYKEISGPTSKQDCLGYVLQQLKPDFPQRWIESDVEMGPIINTFAKYVGKPSTSTANVNNIVVWGNNKHVGIVVRVAPGEIIVHTKDAQEPVYETNLLAAISKKDAYLVSLDHLISTKGAPLIYELDLNSFTLTDAAAGDCDPDLHKELADLEAKGKDIQEQDLEASRGLNRVTGLMTEWNILLDEVSERRKKVDCIPDYSLALKLVCPYPLATSYPLKKCAEDFTLQNCTAEIDEYLKDARSARRNFTASLEAAKSLSTKCSGFEDAAALETRCDQLLKEADKLDEAMVKAQPVIDRVNRAAEGFINWDACLQRSVDAALEMDEFEKRSDVLDRAISEALVSPSKAQRQAFVTAVEEFDKRQDDYFKTRVPADFTARMVGLRKVASDQKAELSSSGTGRLVRSAAEKRPSIHDVIEKIRMRAEAFRKLLCSPDDFNAKAKEITDLQSAMRSEIDSRSSLLLMAKDCEANACSDAIDAFKALVSAGKLSEGEHLLRRINDSGCDTSGLQELLDVARSNRDPLVVDAEDARSKLSSSCDYQLLHEKALALQKAMPEHQWLKDHLGEIERGKSASAAIDKLRDELMQAQSADDMIRAGKILDQMLAVAEQFPCLKDRVQKMMDGFGNQNDAFTSLGRLRALARKVQVHKANADHSAEAARQAVDAAEVQMEVRAADLEREVAELTEKCELAENLKESIVSRVQEMESVQSQAREKLDDLSLRTSGACNAQDAAAAKRSYESAVGLIGQVGAKARQMQAQAAELSERLNELASQQSSIAGSAGLAREAAIHCDKAQANIETVSREAAAGQDAIAELRAAANSWTSTPTGKGLTTAAQHDPDAGNKLRQVIALAQNLLQTAAGTDFRTPVSIAQAQAARCKESRASIERFAEMVESPCPVTSAEDAVGEATRISTETQMEVALAHGLGSQAEACLASLKTGGAAPAGSGGGGSAAGSAANTGAAAGPAGGNPGSTGQASAGSSAGSPDPATALPPGVASSTLAGSSSTNPKNPDGAGNARTVLGSKPTGSGGAVASQSSGSNPAGSQRGDPSNGLPASVLGSKPAVNSPAGSATATSGLAGSGGDGLPFSVLNSKPASQRGSSSGGGTLASVIPPSVGGSKPAVGSSGTGEAGSTTNQSASQSGAAGSGSLPPSKNPEGPGTGPGQSTSGQGATASASQAGSKQRATFVSGCTPPGVNGWPIYISLRDVSETASDSGYQDLDFRAELETEQPGSAIYKVDLSPKEKVELAIHNSTITVAWTRYNGEKLVYWANCAYEPTELFPANRIMDFTGARGKRNVEGKLVWNYKP
jgi:hypothetical protein